MKTIYYYQTFVGLDKLMSHTHDIDVINISSIHFDEDKHGNKNIYLNDNLPNDPKFNIMWEQTQLLGEQGITIMLMVGGAGGAYTNLFLDFETYYPLLRKLLQDKTYISGVDLDIEETVSLVNVKKLINLLKKDFPFIQISMAPVASAMITDSPGLGSFSYKELYNSVEGNHIDSFNVQCYDSFSYETFRRIIKNDYPPEKINMGMMSGQFTKDTFNEALQEIHSTLITYPKMGGVFDWEYLDAPPVKNDPSQWCKLMKDVEDNRWSQNSDTILE
jgi:hypothetical protein